MIPEPLSAVAAEMVTEHDRLIREREEFATWRTREIRRLATIRWVGFGTIIAAVVSLIASVSMRIG